MKMVFLLSLYLILAVILGILAFVLTKKHTSFPNCSVGYHHQKAMESKERWDRTNRLAGRLSAFFAAVGVVLAGLLYAVKAEMNAVLLLFFVYAAVAIAAILVLPVRLSKK